jgi:hypothetical protein
MKKSQLSKSYLALALLGLMVFQAQAATISLSPTGSTAIIVGEVVTFDMYANAADEGGIHAGRLDLCYDGGVISYNGDFAIDGGFPTDPFFSRLGDDCATTLVTGCGSSGEINGIAFGDFGGIANGLTLVGSLSFTGAAVGTSLLTMADNEYPAGSWYDTSGNLISMDYSGESVSVSAVPVPAAVWLFGSGLLGLVGLSRRKIA